MSIGTAICWLAWVYILGNVDPTETGLAGIFFFYASLFLALTGTFSVLGFVFRRLLVKRGDIVFHHVQRTFRQGIFISLIILLALFLLQFRLLRWWNAILLAALFVILEGIIFTNRKHANRDFGAE